MLDEQRVGRGVERLELTRHHAPQHLVNHRGHAALGLQPLERLGDGIAQHARADRVAAVGHLAVGQMAEAPREFPQWLLKLRLEFRDHFGDSEEILELVLLDQRQIGEPERLRIAVRGGQRVAEYPYRLGNLRRHLGANLVAPRAHLALAVDETGLVDIVTGIAGAREQHLVDALEEALDEGIDVLGDACLQWLAHGGIGSIEVRGLSRPRDVVIRRRRRGGGLGELGKERNRLVIGPREGHAHALGDNAGDHELELEIALLAVEHEREVEYRRRLRRRARVGGRIGADEHSTGAEITYGAGHGRPLAHAEVALEIDGHAGKAALLDAAGCTVT